MCAPADLYEMVTAVGGASDDIVGGGSVRQRECFLSSGLEEVKGGLFSFGGRDVDYSLKTSVKSVLHNVESLSLAC